MQETHAADHGHKVKLAGVMVAEDTNGFKSHPDAGMFNGLGMDDMLGKGFAGGKTVGR